MAKPIISADSHITEPRGHLRRPHRQALPRPRAARRARRRSAATCSSIDGMDKPIPMGLVAGAGKRGRGARMFGAKLEELHRGRLGSRGASRRAGRDGVAAEVLYPTVGMMLCNHPDFDYKKACFDAYNLLDRRVLRRPPRPADRRRADCDALGGGGDRGPRQIKALGLRGVMMPGNPAVADYDDPIYGRLRGGDRPRPAAVLSHPHEPAATLQDARPQAQRVPVDHPRLPGHHRRVHPRRRVRATPEAQARVRGSRRGLGAALHVPDGPRLGAAPLLAAGGGALASCRASTSASTSTRPSRTTGWRSR